MHFLNCRGTLSCVRTDSSRAAPLLCTVLPDRPGGWVSLLLERSGPAKQVSRLCLAAIETAVMMILERRNLNINTDAILSSAIRSGERARPLTSRQVYPLPRPSGSGVRMEATPPRRVVERTHWTPASRSPNRLANHSGPHPRHAIAPPCPPTCGPLL
jgi:hypothetical protein